MLASSPQHGKGPEILESHSQLTDRKVTQRDSSDHVGLNSDPQPSPTYISHQANCSPDL